MTPTKTTKRPRVVNRHGFDAYHVRIPLRLDRVFETVVCQDVWRPRRDCVCRTGLGDCCDALPEGSGVRDEGHREVPPDDFGLRRFAALFRERSTVVPNVSHQRRA
jgi:hypothetical protein